MVESQSPGSSQARVPKGLTRVLNRWTSKPQGMVGTSALACVPPAIPVGHLAMDSQFGFYGTRVTNGTIGRPEGRGGGTG